LDLRESIHFSQRCVPFPSPVTLTFDLLTSNWLYQLLLTWVTSSLSLNVVYSFPF